MRLIQAKPILIYIVILCLIFNLFCSPFFQSQSVSFESSSAREKVFLKNAIYLINKAKNATDNGDFFPVWGTCLGF